MSTSQNGGGLLSLDGWGRGERGGDGFGAEKSIIISQASLMGESYSSKFNRPFLIVSI